MNLTPLQQLVEYDLLCNRLCLDTLGSLPADQLHQDFDFGLRTPHATLFHIVEVMRHWSHFVGPTLQDVGWLDYDPGTPLTPIRELHDDTGVHWLNALRESYTRGLLDQDRRLHQTFHLVTYGSHHRAQFLSMLTLLGHSHPYEGGDFGGWSS